MLNNYPDILSSKEACEILKISMHTLYALIRNKDLPARKIGGKYKITKKSIINLLEV